MYVLRHPRGYSFLPTASPPLAAFEWQFIPTNEHSEHGAESLQPRAGLYM